jgi:transcriptional regulator with XRE-family HTH domain
VPANRLLRALRRGKCLSLEEFADGASVSAQTMMRAERGESVNPGSARATAKYLGRSPAELGLRVRGAGPLEEDVDLKRRELLGLINVAGATLGLPALSDIDWPRLDATMAGRVRVDDAALRDRAALNRSLWQAFWASARPGELLAPVQDQLQELMRLRDGVRSLAQEGRLCSLLGEAGQLAGAILCNEGQDTAAAREAGDYDLWAAILIWHAYLPIFDRRPLEALPILQAASQIARRGDSTLATRHAVAAYSAVAYAQAGDAAARERVLDEAERVAELKDGTGTRAWITLDRQHVLEERGASAVCAGRPEEALPALEGALAYWPTPSRHRALIMADLFRSSVTLREADRACAYGRELLDLSRRCSGLFRKELRFLGTGLEPFADVPAVRDLQQQLRLAA